MAPGSSVSTTTATQQIEDQVFLSPRVIDQRAFDDLAGSLKGIVREAVQQSEALLTSTGDVKLLGQQLKDATLELQQRVESAVRVVPTLDQRVARAEQVLGRAEVALSAKESEIRELTSREVIVDRARLALMVEEHLSEIVRDKLSGFAEQLVEKALSAGPVTSKELESTLKRLKDAHDRIGSVTSAAEAKVKSLQTHADAAAAGILSSVEAKTDRLIDDALTRSTTIASEAQGRAAAMVAEAQGRVDALLASFEDDARDTAIRVHQPLSDLVSSAPARIAECEERAGLIVGELQKRLDQLQAVAREAGKMVNPAEAQKFLAAADAATNRAGAMLERLNRGVEQAEDFSRQLTSLSQEAETSRQHFAGSIQHQSSTIDAIERRLHDLATTQETLQLKLDSALARAREADESIERQSQHLAESIDRAAQPTMQRLGQQAQQVGQWLNQLIQQSADVGHRLERVVSEARAAASGKTNTQR